MNNVTKLYDITNSFLVTLYLLYCVLCLYIIDFNSVLEQTHCFDTFDEHLRFTDMANMWFSYNSER
jgi:hypothetical protein